MLIVSLILLLLSNSTTLRRDKPILYSRATITILLLSISIALLLSISIAYDNLYFLFLNKGIGIFGGLFHSTATTAVFHFFILSITSLILLLTSFYPRKVWLEEYSSIDRLMFTKLSYYNTITFYPRKVWLEEYSSIDRLMFTKLSYYNTIILNKMGEQFKIIEYSLIILFIVIGSIFLISSSDLVSIFLAIELQSYGYIFMALVAILTSVISAVYYLAIIKQIFFDKPDYTLNTELKDFNAEGLIFEKDVIIQKVSIKITNIVLSSYLSLCIAIITLTIALFIFIPESLLNLANILALILFNI